MATESAEHGGGGFAIDPMHQFEIKTLFPMQFGNVDASFTNSSLFMVLAVAVVTTLMLVGISRRAMVPGRLQSIVELSYEFIANMLRDNVGSAGLRFFPFVFTLFMFILTLNLLGMIPFSFTVTSHIIVTFALAFFIFIGVTILGFAVHGVGYLKFFVPHGVPVYLLPLVVPIEVVSYLTRPISLSVRLFANMMAGHTVLKVFAGFVIALGAFGVAPGIVPLVFMVGLTGLEVLVAALQAYVFAILTCIYLNDALHMH